MTLEAILDQVRSYGCSLVEMTGGEPLHQRGALVLLTKLCDAGYQVMIETSGAFDISAIDDRVSSVWFELGKCREALHQYDAARDAFVRARDEDICPLRMLSRMEEIVSQIANAEDLPLLDAHALLEADSPQEILGPAVTSNSAMISANSGELYLK